jgi:hypothetical protein
MPKWKGWPRALGQLASVAWIVLDNMRLRARKPVAGLSGRIRVAVPRKRRCAPGLDLIYFRFPPLPLSTGLRVGLTGHCTGSPATAPSPVPCRPRASDSEVRTREMRTGGGTDSGARKPMCGVAACEWPAPNQLYDPRAGVGPPVLPASTAAADPRSPVPAAESDVRDTKRPANCAPGLPFGPFFPVGSKAALPRV